MYVHRSNRAEALVDVLASVVARPLPEALAAECIVVQGRGMERWLAIELSRRLAVWANPDFPFPRKLIERAVAAVLGPGAAPAPQFAPEVMQWAVAAVLPEHLDRPEFMAIRGYLADDDRGVKRVQLAERIATTFDQYALYRPRMVLAWEQGEGAEWQAVLWRALNARHGSGHIAARTAAFLDTLRQHRGPLSGFPARVSVFGISTLPPLYLELLTALSRCVEVHLFVLSPSRQYWAEIRSQREMLRALERRPELGSAAAAALHLEEGHPLLASLGRLGRDFQQALEATADYLEDAEELYAPPGTANMLATLQSDILDLRHRGPHNGDVPPLPVRGDDDSIRIHACHGPMREVEVLHDQLLALFDADPTLQPRDVAVMSPAIDDYAPFIDAVFGKESSGRLHIPFRISDRGGCGADAVTDAFARVLEVVPGRLTAPQVLDLLAIDVIRERFGLTAEDIDLVRTWVAESGIRWGVDAAHRAAVDQPAIEANTWRFGFDRLFLGYAMGGEGPARYRDVLPYDDMEGSTTEVLGRLADLCTTLFGFRERLQTARRLDAWRDDLGDLLEAMVARSGQTAYQHHRIHGALAEIAARAVAGGFDEAVDFDTARAQLAAELDRNVPAYGFLGGAVTFCALVPMRTIPFRVLGLLGMNDDSFPRRRRPLSFDLIAQHPQPGDRSARDDDRYLFLEALLSARERLLITYVGQSLKDNAEIPPSVVISELLDVLDQSFVLAAPEAAAVRTHVVVQHPLQPFSPRYFGAGSDARLFSYAHSFYDGARALVGPRVHRQPFLSRPLPADTAAVVSLDDLVRFFEHPVRAFLQRRLDLYLGDDATRIEAREPLELDFLQQWQVGDALLRLVVAGHDLAGACAAVQAAGRLPLGTLGQCAFDTLRPQVEAIATRVAALTRDGRLAPVEIAHQLDDERGTQLIGIVRDVWPAGQVRWQYSRLGGRQELGLWIRHVLLNCVAPPGWPRDSYLLGRPQEEDGAGAIRFRPLDDARAVLADLLRLYWLGQTLPLPLFPRASRTYVEVLLTSGNPGRAFTAAQRQWQGSQPVPGDGSDAYIAQVFGGADPIDPAFRLVEGDEPVPGFADLARAVYGPLLEHREECA